MANVGGIQKPLFGKADENAPTFQSVLGGKLGRTSDFKDLWLKAGIFLKDLFVAYSTGDNSKVDKTLTREYFEVLSGKLLNRRKNARDYPYYEGIRKLLQRALEGVYRCMQSDETIKSLTNQLEILEEKASILTDTDKLRQYIEDLKKSSVIFEPQQFTVIPALLKPQYAEYIKLYGFPPDGIFEAERLATIKRKLTLQVDAEEEAMLFQLNMLNRGVNQDPEIQNEVVNETVNILNRERIEKKYVRFEDNADTDNKVLVSTTTLFKSNDPNYKNNTENVEQTPVQAQREKRRNLHKQQGNVGSRQQTGSKLSLLDEITKRQIKEQNFYRDHKLQKSSKAAISTNLAPSIREQLGSITSQLNQRYQKKPKKIGKLIMKGKKVTFVKNK